MKSQRHRWRHFHTFLWPCCSVLWSQQPGVQALYSWEDGEPPGTSCCPVRFNRGNAKLWKWNSWGQGRADGLCETRTTMCAMCPVTKGGLQPIFQG